MKLEILRVQNQGDATEEYVLFEAVEDCNLNRYALYDATYTGEGKISNKMRHFFRFPSHDVAAGDLVSLRTGKGKRETLVNNLGRTVHRYFWNLNEAVWNDEQDAAVLLEIADWKTTAASSAARSSV